ncbi:hypothetical protein PADK2_20645 [Pseudomonas aeruginosa DK2]|nr:hypothetical protein PADK2_20645 [Pseudomonas aeruginosa DK2]KFB21714.1 hypothetical protein PGPR2_22805 [Pseudomonas aeruginosa PGPR2]
MFFCKVEQPFFAVVYDTLFESFFTYKWRTVLSMFDPDAAHPDVLMLQIL